MFPVYLKEDRFEEPDDPIYYLVTRDGLFQVKRTGALRSCTRVRGISWLEGEREGVRVETPKIPAAILREAVAFFRAVFDEHKAEAVVLLFYHPGERRFACRIPPQNVAGGHCRYEIGPTPPGFVRVGTMHSHASADAFHSELDDLDERHDDGLHITVGNMDGVHSVSCSVVVDGRRFPIKPRDVLEVLPHELGPLPRWPGQDAVDSEPTPRDSDVEGRPSSV